MNLDEQLFIQEGRWRGRLITLGILAALGLVAGVLVYAFFFRSEGSKARPTEDLKVGKATINANLIISGKADAQLISDLSFRASGKVESVDVKVGDAVHQGDVLASLESADLANSVASAQANLALAQARLTALLEGATDAELAAAAQSVESAQVGVNRADRDLQKLLEGAQQPELTVAQQAVVTAETALNQAQRDKTKLLEGPTQAEVASAQQTVASAQTALNQAERARDELQQGATAAELAAAEQTVTAAEANLASAQASLDRLTAPASAAQVAAATAQVATAQQALDSARVALDTALSNVDSAEAALRAAGATFCAAAPDDPSCNPLRIPLPDDQVRHLLNELSDTSTDVTLLADISSLVQRNSAYEIALNSVTTARESGTSAETALAAAQANLAALLAGPAARDVAAAQAAVDAAHQNLALAQLRLSDLRAGPRADDLANADDAVRSAQAVFDAATARLDDLVAPPSTDDLARADDAVRSAEAALATAQAKQADLLDAPKVADVASAQDAKRSAQAGLGAAIASRDETKRGPKESRIEQERQSVRVAQLAVAAAQIRVRDAQIISPFDGTVAAMNLKPGEFTGVGSATPAIVLLTPDAIVLKMSLGETDYPNVKLDQKGIVVFDAFPGKPYPFTVLELGLSPTVTQGVVTYAVTGALAIPPDSPRPAPGMSASGQIITDSRPNVIAIPPRAIRRSGADQVVDVRRNGAVQEQVISTGLSDTNNVEVLSGLSEGDVLVVPLLVSGSSSKPQTAPTLPSGIR